MPLGGNGTYIPTMQEFETHWTAVNAVGLPDMSLAGGFTLANFTTLIGTVDAAITDSINKQNLQTNSAGDRDIQKAAQRNRLKQFRAASSATFPGSRYLLSLPKLYATTAPQGAVTASLDDMASLWLAMNTNVPPYTGFTPPLLLASGYPIATFNTDLAALRATYAAYQLAAQNAQQSRASRDEQFAIARERMRQYRQGVVAFLPAGHALLATIPALSPPAGATPLPVNAGGVWNEGTDMADLSWTASDNPDLKEYSIRGCSGSPYRAAEETVLDTVDPSTLEYSTDFGLVASGSISTFKVYVVLNAGNEKGSNSVKITRP